MLGMKTPEGGILVACHTVSSNVHRSHSSEWMLYLLLGSWQAEGANWICTFLVAFVSLRSCC